MWWVSLPGQRLEYNGCVGGSTGILKCKCGYTHVCVCVCIILSLPLGKSCVFRQQAVREWSSGQPMKVALGWKPGGGQDFFRRTQVLRQL